MLHARLRLVHHTGAGYGWVAASAGVGAQTEGVVAARCSGDHARVGASVALLEASLLTRCETIVHRGEARDLRHGTKNT